MKSRAITSVMQNIKRYCVFCNIINRSSMRLLYYASKYISDFSHLRVRYKNSKHHFKNLIHRQIKTIEPPKPILCEHRTLIIHKFRTWSVSGRTRWGKSVISLNKGAQREQSSPFQELERLGIIVDTRLRMINYSNGVGMSIPTDIKVGDKRTPWFGGLA